MAPPHGEAQHEDTKCPSSSLHAIARPPLALIAFFYFGAPEVAVKMALLYVNSALSFQFLKHSRVWRDGEWEEEGTVKHFTSTHTETLDCDPAVATPTNY